MKSSLSTGFGRKNLRENKKKKNTKNTVPNDDFDAGANRNPTMFSVLHSPSFWNSCGECWHMQRSNRGKKKSDGS